jgi:hypothetical protein
LAVVTVVDYDLDKLRRILAQSVDPNLVKEENFTIKTYKPYSTKDVQITRFDRKYEDILGARRLQ